MKTQGEIEAAVCDGIASLEQEVIGRGPKDVKAHLLGNRLVVCLQIKLTTAEQHLVKTEKGRDLIKQVRTQLIELARPVMVAMVQTATGVKVLSLQHDVSTTTCEEVVRITLTETPLVREKKNRLSHLRDYSQRVNELDAAVAIAP